MGWFLHLPRYNLDLQLGWAWLVDLNVCGGFWLVKTSHGEHKLTKRPTSRKKSNQKIPEWGGKLRSKENKSWWLANIMSRGFWIPVLGLTAVERSLKSLCVLRADYWFSQNIWTFCFLWACEPSSLWNETALFWLLSMFATTQWKGPPHLSIWAAVPWRFSTGTLELMCIKHLE